MSAIEVEPPGRATYHASMRKRLAPALLAVLACLSATSIARADHPEIEAARAAFERAELDAALAHYDAAERDGPLDRDALITLLRERAVVRHAAQDTAGAERDLVALLTLAPDASLDRTAPPALQRAFARLHDEVTEPLSVRVALAREGDERAVRARTTGDVGGLVREVRIGVATGSGWRVEASEVIALDAGAGSLRVYAEVVGPGGAVLARDGSRDAPRVLVDVTPDAVALVPPPPAGDDSGLFIGLGIAGGLLVVAGVILAVVFGTMPVGIQPTSPMEVNP